MLRSQTAIRLIAAAFAGVLAAQLGEQMRGNGIAPAKAAIPPRPALQDVIKTIVERIAADNLSLVAAGVAFYAFLAFFPAAAALVAVYGLVADPRVVEGQVSDLSGLLPQSAIDLILSVVKSVAEKPPGQLGLTFGVSVLIALWSARAGITSLMSGLDIAYRNRTPRSFLAQTAVGLGLTLGGILIAVLLVGAIAGLPALYAAAPAVVERVSAPWVAWLRWPIVAIEMTISLAVIYRVAPSKRLEGSWLFSPGALIATILWLASSSAFSLYVSWSHSYDATYGSLAGVVVMMLWLWASSLSVLVGATVDDVLYDKDP